MTTAGREEILAHLQVVLAAPRFVAASRNASFLRYVVERTMEGKADEIKETVIAADVYGRPGTYDPKSDSIVRVEATRLRQKLRAYYDNEGASSPIRIHLPSGTYVPTFEIIETVPAPEPATAVPPEFRGAGASSRGRSAAWAGLAAAALVVPTLLAFRTAPQMDRALSEALAAWKEAVVLLEQDPHTADTARGTPPLLTRALERLEFAVARDPGFARAWATLAEAYDYAFPFTGRDQRADLDRAEQAARRAVALDANLSAAHHMLGLILWNMKWNPRAAEPSYRKALELDPRNVNAAVEYADLLRQMGRTEAAAQMLRTTRALLPSAPQIPIKEAEVLLDLGQVERAIETANHALSLKRDALRAWIVLGAANEMKQDYDAALGYYERVLQVLPDDRRALPAYGYLLGRVGRRDEALQVARKLERINSEVRNCAFQVGVVYAGLGDVDRALDWLERAWRTHQVHFPFAAVEPRLRDLRSHPRLQQLLAGISAT